MTIGSIVQLTWDSYGIPSDQLVKLELWEYGIFKEVIVASTPNTGTYDWDTTGIDPCEGYRIRIELLACSYVNNITEIYFGSAIGTLAFKGALTEGLEFEILTDLLIEWDFVGLNEDATVDIELWKDGSFYSTIASGINCAVGGVYRRDGFSRWGDGSYTWSIPNLPNADNYMIKIKMHDCCPLIYGNTENLVIREFIHIDSYVYPRTELGYVKPITWTTTTPNASELVELVIVDSSENVLHTIATNLAGDEDYLWDTSLLPAVYKDGSTFLLMARQVANPIVRSVVKETCMIVTTSTSYRPEVGTSQSRSGNFQVGITQPVDYTDFGEATIELWKSGELVWSLIAYMEGSYTGTGEEPPTWDGLRWDHISPTTVPLGADYRVRIHIPGTAIDTMTAGDFTIVE